MRPDESFIVISSYLGLNISVQHLHADGTLDPSWNNGQGAVSMNGDLNGLEVDGVAFAESNTLDLRAPSCRRSRARAVARGQAASRRTACSTCPIT